MSNIYLTKCQRLHSDIFTLYCILDDTVQDSYSDADRLTAFVEVSEYLRLNICNSSSIPMHGLDIFLNNLVFEKPDYTALCKKLMHYMEKIMDEINKISGPVVEGK